MDPDSGAILASRPEDAKALMQFVSGRHLGMTRWCSNGVTLQSARNGLSGAGEQNRKSQDPDDSPRGIKKQIQPARLSPGDKALVDFVQEAVSQHDGRGKKEGSNGESPVHFRGNHPCGEQAQGEELSEMEEEIRVVNGKLMGETERRGMEDGSHQEEGGQSPVEASKEGTPGHLSQGQPGENDGAQEKEEGEAKIRK